MNKYDYITATTLEEKVRLEKLIKYMEDNNIFNIDYNKDIMIKDLNLNDNSYVVFCWNKKDYYHMISIIDNVIYDKNFDCMNLYVISIYKKNEICQNT